MYQPAHAQFIERRADRLHQLLREYPFGTLVTQTERGVEANHVPFLLDDSQRKLTAHVPRANPVWKDLGHSVLVIFQGPNAYISPSWYVSKQMHGKAVPTWNYAVVHLRGVARAIEDRHWLRSHLEELTETHERRLDHPWAVADAPADYIDKLLGAIVGIEIEISQMEGKFKLGQNRSQDDQQSVVRELERAEPSLAKFVNRQTTT
jgi:transcriptional regulator